MKQNLVTGEFTKKDAIEVIKKLYNSKIQFHTIQDFSCVERGLDPKKHRDKIKELTKSLKSILEFIESSDKELFDLDCVVNIN